MSIRKKANVSDLYYKPAGHAMHAALSSTVCSKRTRKVGCEILIAHISAREPGSRYQKFQADFVG